MKRILSAILILILVLSGCQKTPETPETLKAGLSKEEAARPAAPAGTASPEEPTPLNENDAELLSHCVRNEGVSENEALLVLRHLLNCQTDLSNSPLCFYQSQPYEGGSLVLAASCDGTAAVPNLYYILNGAVRWASFTGDGGSINLARFADSTLLFGLDFSDGQAADSVTATFSDGTSFNVELSPGAADPFPAAFLLIAEGSVDPLAVTLHEGNASLSATDTASLLANAGQFAPWAGNGLAIRNCVRLVSLWEGAPQWTDREIGIPGNEMDLYDWEFTCYYKEQLAFLKTDLWRTNNANWQAAERKGGETIRLYGLPDEILSVTLVNLSLDQGQESAAIDAGTPLAIRGEGFTLPAVSEKTFFKLIIELADESFVLPLIVNA